MRLVVAITGATGAVIGIRLLEALRRMDVETHLVMSRWARSTIALETDYTVREVTALATVHHGSQDQGASISSGSFPVDGMVIVPCSMKTVAGIRSGYAQDLVGRAADVTLKEGRKLVLVARETPLSTIHLENLLALSRMGVTILPPAPAFYNHPKDLDDVVDHIVARALDQFGLRLPTARRWSGLADDHRGRTAVAAGSEGLTDFLPADDGDI
jgi:4-hydroxy-3-polyprenylbenzoate decarboxylase